jgi:hypothetical protein
MLGVMVSVVVAGFFSAGASAKPCSEIRSFDFRNATIRVGVADENPKGPRGMADSFHLQNGSELIYDEFGSLKSENPEWGVDLVDDRVVHPDPSTRLRVIVLVDDHLGGTGTWTYVLAFDCQRGNLVRLFQYSGEGVGLKRLTDQTIELDQSIWRPTDAHCCPSQDADLAYRWIATLHRFRRVANVLKNGDETPSNKK